MSEPTAMALARPTPVVVLVAIAASAVTPGCSSGTTAVCDDAGSCLILVPSDGGNDGGANEAASDTGVVDAAGDTGVADAAGDSSGD